MTAYRRREDAAAVDRTLLGRPYALDVIRRCIERGVYKSHELLEGDMSSREELIAAVSRAKAEHPEWGSAKIARALNGSGMTGLSGGAVTSSVIDGVRFRGVGRGNGGQPVEPEPAPDPAQLDQVDEPDGYPAEEESPVEDLEVHRDPAPLPVVLDVAERIYRALASDHDDAAIRGGLRAIQIVREIVGERA